MKLGIVRIEDQKLTGAQYFDSAWDRELGDVLSIDGRKWRVAMIGESRNQIINELNKIIKKNNSIIRKKNKLENQKSNQMFRDISNKIYQDLDLGRYKV